MQIIWSAIRPFVYFTVLVVGSLCFLYLFDKLGGGGEYAVELEAQVHRFECQFGPSDMPTCAQYSLPAKTKKLPTAEAASH